MEVRDAYLRALTPEDGLSALVADRRADVLALPAALRDRIPRVARVCAAVRALDPARLRAPSRSWAARIALIALGRG